MTGLRTVRGIFTSKQIYMIRIIAIRVVDRIKESGNTQKVLTTHSDLILARLGFHELNEMVCSREGYIVLQLRNDHEACSAFMNDLKGIYGIEIKELLLCDSQPEQENVPAGAKVTLAAVKILDRHEIVTKVQKVLSLYGCSIRTRMGINLGAESGNQGLIILELCGDIDQINSLAARLYSLENTCSGLIWFG